MPLNEVDIDDVYKNDDDLKRGYVKNLQEWVEKQPHLPDVTELQMALFLQSCYYSNEQAKYTIETYFTVKTLCPDIFGNRIPSDPALQTSMNTLLITPLPKKTPSGDTVIFIKLMDVNPDNYNFALQIRCFDMITLLHLHLNGPEKGIVIVFDMTGIAFAHFLKISVVVMKKVSLLSTGMPIRLKSLQFFNIVSFMDKILALMKPFMKKELIDALYLHNDVTSLFNVIPQDVLPQEYGGSCESLHILQGKYKTALNDNADFFKFQDSQLVDESKRPGRPKNVSDVFGMEGTFKKLEVD